MIKRLLLSIGILSSLFIVQLAPLAAAQDVTNQIQSGLCAGSNLDLNNIDNPSGSCSNDALQRVNNIIRHIVNILSAIVGVVAVIMIIIGGFRYITSGGNDTSITSAKNTILYAVIGLVIVALAQVLVHFVLRNITNS
jgi:hypothetical protein